jgi:catechol 2,3-dioxygenase-like lactoylglutathione lyase family enzyme
MITFRAPIPILRIFSVEKAKEFYVGFLGFTVDWEHRFGDNFPVFMQMSRAGLKLFLSEHHGDGSPGVKVHVPMSGIDALRTELTAKNYRYMKPGIEEQPWGTREMTVIDPSGNHIIFSEAKAASSS